MPMRDDPLQTFREEAHELLAELEESLLGLEEDPRDLELIDAAFRSLHTIKGSGGMFDLPVLVGCAHAVEAVFDRLRTGEVPVTGQLINLALQAKDHLEALLFTPEVPGLREQGNEILTALETWGPPRDGGQNQSSPTPTGSPAAATVGVNRTFQIGFAPGRNYFRNGGNPLGIFEELWGLGEVKITGVTDGLPTLSEMKPDACYLRWDISLTTDADVESVRDAFMFVSEAVSIQERAPGAKVTPETGSPANAETPADTESPAQTTGSAPATRTVGPAPLASGSPADDSSSAAGTAPSSETSSHIKVPSEKLDSLVNLAGEFVSSHAHLLHLAELRNDNEMFAAGEALGALVRNLRELSMDLPMVPVSTVVGSFRRLVRDLSEQLNKNVVFRLEGGDTQIDKHVLDTLKDPVMHILRNGVGHGIESAEIRRAAGKPETGTVRIVASHTGSEVMLDVSDDGAGIPPALVYRAAVERRLIAPDHELSQEDLLQLIFHPGFSTAQQATTVSGRGVGMDVVKRTAVRLGGTATVRTAEGMGTTISLRLPVSVSIVEGLLTRVGDGYYMIKLSHIERCLDMRSVHRVPGQDMIDFGGDALPYRDLRTIFQIIPEGDETQIVVVSSDSGRVGLLVDQVFDTHQAVIKPLGRILHGVSGIAGTLILGDGTPALLIDVDGLT